MPNRDLRDSAPAPAPAVSDPALVDPALTDAGLGPMEPMPDPMLSDLGMGGPMGADPLAGWPPRCRPRWGLSLRVADWVAAARLMLSPGRCAPLAGLASQLGEQVRREEPDPRRRVGEGQGTTSSGRGRGQGRPRPRTRASARGNPAVHGAAIGHSARAGARGHAREGAPPAAPGPPPPPPTAITLPDGSTANARTPELAQAVKAHLDGKPLRRPTANSTSSCPRRALR